MGPKYPSIIYSLIHSLSSLLSTFIDMIYDVALGRNDEMGEIEDVDDEQASKLNNPNEGKDLDYSHVDLQQVLKENFGSVSSSVPLTSSWLLLLLIYIFFLCFC